MKIGVLALQGSFAEHRQMLKKSGAEAVDVYLPRDLKNLDGLIIPGGESTTIGKLAVTYNFIEPLRCFAAEKAVWGTCAGMIFMAKGVGMEQPLLNLMDITVERNAFGRQLQSFEIDVYVNVLNNGNSDPFPGIFIRAPKIAQAKGSTEILARLKDGTIVAARQGKWMVTSFHPELTTDIRFHQYFISLSQNH
ncbi:MAG: pyridoxal 5'-phosphate synthase glutaminase subunit PdxT [Desulfobacterales bacterium]|nr:pyridoxal 5'-phosphate synthase glutaminase subunit PdxT [Desulfobacterales bacterium]